MLFIVFIPHSNPESWVLLSHIFRWRDWGSKRSNDLLMVTEPLAKPGFKTSLTPPPVKALNRSWGAWKTALGNEIGQPWLAERQWSQEPQHGESDSTQDSAQKGSSRGRAGHGAFSWWADTMRIVFYVATVIMTWCLPFRLVGPGKYCSITA